MDGILSKLQYKDIIETIFVFFIKKQDHSSTTFH